MREQDNIVNLATQFVNKYFKLVYPLERQDLLVKSIAFMIENKKALWIKEYTTEFQSANNSLK